MSPRSPLPLPSGTPSGALGAVLADLGARVRRGRGLAREVAGERPCCPTGLVRLDARLGGGFPRGRLSELCGPPSSGRTSLATRLLAETLGRGVLAAWIDLADAFDPASAAAAVGSDEALRGLLWVRPRSLSDALRGCERILQTEGFELVLLDLAGHRAGAQERVDAIRDADWLRLARLAARQQSALVVLSEAPRCASRAELVLELSPGRARFSASPRLLDALETKAVLRRHRTRPTAGPDIPLQLDAAPTADSAPDLLREATPHAALEPSADAVARARSGQRRDVAAD